MTSQISTTLPSNIQELIEAGYAKHKAIARKAKEEREEKARIDQERVEKEWEMVSTALLSQFPEYLRPYITINKEQQIYLSHSYLSADLELDDCAPIWISLLPKLDNGQCTVSIEKIVVAHLDEDEIEAWSFSSDWYAFVYKLSELDLALAHAHREWKKISEARQNIKAYGEACKNYLELTEAAKAHNIALIEKIRQELEYQNMYAVADSAYVLEYGITSNEDGETYTETRTVWVLDDKPDENGCYTVIQRGGQLTQTHYFHVVSISSDRLLPSSHLVTLKPKNAPKNSDKSYDINLIPVTRSTFAYSIINKMYDDESLPEPKKPNPAEFELNQYSTLVRRIEEKACVEVYGEDYF